jgi:2-oxoisovalerate dehydrogenase E2 component (dihydrolipoyl transacylase)
MNQIEAQLYCPDLGEGLTTATIKHIYCNVNDTIKKDQPLLALETDKITVDIPAPSTLKVIKIMVKAEQQINLKQALLTYESSETILKQTPNSQTTQTISHQDATTVSSTAQNVSSQIKAIPAARLLAQSLKIDLTILADSSDKTISVADVVNAYQQKTRAPQTSICTLTDECYLPKTINLHDITALVIQLICHALQQNPKFNGFHHTVNLGLAHQQGNTLSLPVIEAVDQLDSLSIRKKINDLKKGKKNQAPHCKPTFVYSNIGSIGGRYANAMLAPGCYATLVTGALFQQPALESGQLFNRNYLPLSLCFDHNHFNGADAAHFLASMIKKVELMAENV